MILQFNPDTVCCWRDNGHWWCFWITWADKTFANYVDSITSKGSSWWCYLWFCICKKVTDLKHSAYLIWKSNKFYESWLFGRHPNDGIILWSFCPGKHPLETSMIGPNAHLVGLKQCSFIDSPDNVDDVAAPERQESLKMEQPIWHKSKTKNTHFCPIYLLIFIIQWFI